MTFAVQPTAFASFDEWGCDWATDLEHAQRLAMAWGEECMIWAVPATGSPYRWMRAGGSIDQIDQIADLVFGA